MKWYQIKAAGPRAAGAGNHAEVFIYGDIGESWYGDTVAANDFVREFSALDADTIDVRINSFGGSVSDGLAIFNAIRRHNAHVTTYVDGVAMSIASLIFMAGIDRVMAENAMLMIHAPWGYAAGNSAELRDYADTLDKFAAAMVSSYAGPSGIDAAEIEALLTDGTDHYFSAAEALNAGYATETTAALAIAASAQRPDADFWAGRAKQGMAAARAALKPTATPAASKAEATLSEPQLKQIAAALAALHATPAAPAVNPPAAAAASTQKGPEMTPEEIKAAEKKAADDARAALQKHNAELLATGKAYAKHGGEALAMQAMSEGWTQEQLKDAIMAKMNAGPAHVAYGQGAQVTERIEQDPKRGFAHLGEFAFHVKAAETSRGRNLDERLRLMAAASTYANESTGADGGFAVPPEFASEIWAPAFDNADSLLALADTTPVQGNSMTFPKDETTPWGTNGVKASWDGEGASATEKKAVLGKDTLALHKLRVLVPATDELLEDSTAMGAHLTRQMSASVMWKTNDAIVNGTGAGMPLGIRVGSAIVSQAKETGQTADTIVAENVAKMLGRCLIGMGGNLVWLMNPDAYNQVITLTIGNQPVFTMPNGGIKEAPNGLLLGRRVILTDTCQTLGDLGDIVLANMSGYRAITKSAGMRFSESMHLHFDQDITTFKLVFRMDGQPALTAPVTPPNSSVTRSHFVQLAARA